jgi:hypothetical protein
MSKVVSSSFDQYQQIWASSEGMRSPKMYTFDPALVSADANGFKISHPGLYAAAVGNGKARLLPRTRLTTASATNAATLVISANTIPAFVATDVLHVMAPYAIATFTGTWANSDTATVVLNGITFSYVVAGYSTLAALATTFAGVLNANQQFSQIALAAASGAAVWILAKDLKSLYAISTQPSDTTAGDGTLPITGSATALAYSNTAVGTVSTLAHSTNTITLTGNAGVAVPVGVAIGVRTVKPIGLIGKPHDYTSTFYFPGDDNNELGIYQSGSVYRARLPYVDGEVEQMFPELILV